MDGRNTDALSVWEIMRIGLLSDTHGWLDVKIEEFLRIVTKYGIAGISAIWLWRSDWLRDLS